MKLIKYLLFVPLFYIVGCSAAETSTKETEESSSNETQSVYVFDDVTTNDATSTAAEEVPVTKEETKLASETVSQDSTYTFDFETKDESNTTFQFFIVQLGAFSTLEKAKTFVNSTKYKTDHEMNIHYSEKVKLHVVQLSPFRTRANADEVRDELRKIKEFSGAFIVPNK